MADKTATETLERFDLLPDSALIPASVVAGVFSCHASNIWRMSADGRLAKPVKVSPQVTRWRVADIRAALAKLAA